MVNTPDSTLTQSLRSFGRRKGRRLRTHAQELMGELLPRIQINEWPEAFSGKPAWLEIGFGGGEHLAHIASLHPTIQMIGCEPYVNGISGLLKAIEETHSENIRIYSDDVRLLLGTMPEACLERVYILYPDPWPKSRHHKRRLIQKPLLDLLAKAMKSGAELRIATDWDDYATWILEQLLPHPAFEWTAELAADWSQPWLEWIPTRYEQKARREGRTSSYLIWKRR